jgi:hypothetical protein
VNSLFLLNFRTRQFSLPSNSSAKTSQPFSKTIESRVKSMRKILRVWVPLIAAGLYVAFAGGFLVVAMTSTDEFGYRFIPPLFVSFPLSFLLSRQFEPMPSVIVGAVVNTAAIFGILRFVATFRAPGAPK